MSCNTKRTIVEVAIRALLKELVATYEARRGKRKQATCPCTACKAVRAEVTP